MQHKIVVKSHYMYVIYIGGCHKNIHSHMARHKQENLLTILVMTNLQLVGCNKQTHKIKAITLLIKY